MLIGFSVYCLIGNILLYKYISFFAMKITPVPTKLLLSFSLFCCMTAVVLTKIDAYQTLHNEHTFARTNFWRFFYWSSFVFGYVVFVILSESDRVGGSTSFLQMWVDFYKARLLLFGSGFIAFLVGLILLLRADLLKMFAQQI